MANNNGNFNNNYKNNLNLGEMRDNPTTKKYFDDYGKPVSYATAIVVAIITIWCSFVNFKKSLKKKH